eukprot:UN00820
MNGIPLIGLIKDEYNIWRGGFIAYAYEGNKKQNDDHLNTCIKIPLFCNVPSFSKTRVWWSIIIFLI